MSRLGIAVALAATFVGLGLVLGACPPAPGNGVGPTTYPYTCENGTAAEGTTDAPNTVRCLYACENGTAAEGTTDAPNTMRCVRCANGWLPPADGRCAVPTRYTCSDGTADTGGPQTNSNAEKCTDCNSGSMLTDEYACVSSFIAGTDSAETLDGTPNDDTIAGRGGDDTLNGLAGNDHLIGGTGNDTLFGNAGDDTFRFSGIFGIDSIGTDITADIDNGDTLVFADEATPLTFGYISGTNDITIGQGANMVTIYSAQTTPGSEIITIDGIRIHFTLTDFMLTQGSASYSVMVGTSNDDRSTENFDPSRTTFLRGNSMANIIFGLDGSDLIDGREENDIIIGGAGNDTIQGDEGDDMIVGGPGNDILTGGGGHASTADDAEGSDMFIFDNNFDNDHIGYIFTSGIDATDTLVFNNNADLTLSWSNNDLTITQGSDSVLVYGANSTFSDGGFTIMWNNITERVDSTTDLLINGM